MPANQIDFCIRMLSETDPEMGDDLRAIIDA